jgi:uncharacterized protein YndB with AHSA1/START domain
VSELRTVTVEREFAHPADKLWRALTQPHLIEEWLMKNDFLPVRGHKFTLRREPKPGVEVVVDCEVVEVDPNRSLSYKWSAFGLESVVTFTLTPTANGTVLRMDQSGFRPDQDRAFKGARASWPQMLEALDEVLRKLD